MRSARPAGRASLEAITIAAAATRPSLNLDCIATLPGGRRMLYGRAASGTPTPGTLAVRAGGSDCAIDYARLHPGPTPASEHRFSLLLAPPPAGGPAVAELVLSAGQTSLRLPIDETAIAGDLNQATAARDPMTAFALLRDCAGNPALASLLRHGPAPFGALTDWLARLGTVRGGVLPGGGSLNEVEALTSACGEVLVALRSTSALPADATFEMVAIGLLPDGQGQAAVPVPLLDWRATALPQALVGLGRIDPAWLDRLSTLELVLAVWAQPGEPLLLRCRPRPTTVPDLLDAICRATPFADWEPAEAAAAAALALLRQEIARREARILPMLAALARPPGQSGPAIEDRLPRLAVILAADDPLAARLFQVTAAEIEGRCEQLLVLGDAAAEVAEVFARRGRVPVQAGPSAILALREASGRCMVLPIEAPRFAEAIARGGLAEAIPPPLGSLDLALLAALHAAAGCEGSISDSLARLLRLRRASPGEPGFLPVKRGWAGAAAANLINRHLERLWQTGLRHG